MAVLELEALQEGLEWLKRWRASWSFAEMPKLDRLKSCILPLETKLPRSAGFWCWGLSLTTKPRCTGLRLWIQGPREKFPIKWCCQTSPSGSHSETSVMCWSKTQVGGKAQTGRFPPFPKSQRRVFARRLFVVVWGKDELRYAPGSETLRSPSPSLNTSKQIIKRIKDT